MKTREESLDAVKREIEYQGNMADNAFKRGVLNGIISIGGSLIVLCHELRMMREVAETELEMKLEKDSVPPQEESFDPVEYHTEHCQEYKKPKHARPYTEEELRALVEELGKKEKEELTIDNLWPFEPHPHGGQETEDES